VLGEEVVEEDVGVVAEFWLDPVIELVVADWEFEIKVLADTPEDVDATIGPEVGGKVETVKSCAEFDRPPTLFVVVPSTISTTVDSPVIVVDPASPSTITDSAFVGPATNFDYDHLCKRCNLVNYKLYWYFFLMVKSTRRIHPHVIQLSQ